MENIRQLEFLKPDDVEDLSCTIETIDASGFICRICSSYYSSLQYLSTHIKTRHPEHAFECQLCDKVFASGEDFDEHTTTHICHICGYTAKRINAHMRIHRRTHICEVCQVIFLSPKTLSDHKRCCYNDEAKLRLKYECSICMLRFEKLSKLYNHMDAIHAGKTYNCEVCLLACPSKVHLKRHRKSTCLGKRT